MKKTPLIILATILFLPASHAKERIFDFSKPPYELNEPIIGKDGWQEGSIDGSENDASIIETTNGNLLHVYSTASGPYRTSLRNTFEKVNDPEVHISAGWRGSGNQGTLIALGAQDWNVPVVLNFTTTNGIYVLGEEVTTLLEFEKVRNDGYLYQFKIKLNYDNRTFDVEMTGKDINDNPVIVSHTGLAFPLGTQTGLSDIFIANTGGNTKDMYIQLIRINDKSEK